MIDQEIAEMPQKIAIARVSEFNISGSENKRWQPPCDKPQTPISVYGISISKMEGIDVMNMLRNGDFMIKLDLGYAYFPFELTTNSKRSFA